MGIRRIWLVALLGMGAVLLSACGEPLEDAIERAEAGYVSMDRDARQATIDDLKDALDGDAGVTPEDRGRATAWLGMLLVRHDRAEEARALLADFDATADQLIAAGDPISAVRGLGVLGGALARSNRDFDAQAPLQRALATAQEANLMTHPVVFEAMIQMAWLAYLPGVGGNEESGRADHDRSHDDVGASRSDCADRRAPGDFRLGRIDAFRAYLLREQFSDPGESTDVAQEAVKLLVAALSRLPSDHPGRVGAATFLAEIAVGFCEGEVVDRWSRDAVNTAQIIYGDKAERTFQTREAHGDLLMQLGDVSRGREIILDARKVHYADGGETLQDPADLYQDDGTLRRCIDPPR